ncbi:MAG TPA: glycosyltransferase family 4 protein [Kiritimatiellia bacterium]|nr:glycosyltransferase family 4 protein [Kiritimatiellia bacterium]HRZ11512.1 glycosyltransferase family 4 protein [Kiritimatiellia bacterium]HSA16937.1 glycosyltransferase family 4 protein [Kiritimatiellia bacterium]
MKIAYLCEPQAGGTFTFFQRVRPRLAALGVDFRCVPPYSVETFAGSRFEGLEGVDFLELPDGLPDATRALVRHLELQDYRGALILPGCDVLTTNLARYLPRGVRCAARVALMARSAYVSARAVAGHLNAVFAVSHRVAHDLEHSYGFPAGSVRIAYNGAVLRPLPARDPGRRPFRLIYTGRLSDLDKGTLMLPAILRQALDAGADVFLTAVGNGPDEQRLREGFRRLGLEDRVELLGNQPLDRVDRLLDESDGFLLPSRLEACPNAMLQAMAAGCAPVAFRIHDSVDRIVEDGVSGLLAPVGDVAAFAQAVVKLAGDRALCARMSAAARKRIEEHFSAERTAQLYAEGFRAMLDGPDRRAPALSLDRYEVPRELKPTWRTLIPAPVKNMLRKWMERFGRTA